MSELTIAEEEEEEKSGSSDGSEEAFPDTSIQLQHISGDRYAIVPFISSLEGAMKLKFIPFCSPCDMLLHATIFGKVKISIFRPKTMDYSPWFYFWSPKMV